ncbi:MAG: YceI family protein [Bacteroidales bacterium]|nr:YceI family protein [Bacteroidales bacterium]
MKRKLFKGLFASAIVLFASAATLLSQEYNADREKTLVKWEGKGVGKAHNGTIEVKSGTLYLEAGLPVRGEVVVDMTSMVNLDLDSESMKERLIGHLKSDDFFSVADYPEAHFTITSSELKDGRVHLRGDLKIKGKSHPAEVASEMSAVGDDYRFTGMLEFDRSLYDVRFGSGKFFDNLGDKLISDIITLDFEFFVKEAK